MINHLIRFSNPDKTPIYLYSDMFRLSDEIWRTTGTVKVLRPGELFELQVEIENDLVPVLHPFYFNNTRNIMITAVDREFQETPFPRGGGTFI